MRVLWVSNSPIGPAANILGEEYKGSSGGWIQSEYETLDKANVDLFILSTLSSVKRGKILCQKNEIGEVYCVHAPKLSTGVAAPQILQDNVREIIEKIKPDVIQIWGTETWLSSAVSKCKTAAPKIIYIQGLLGIHKRYLGGYFGNLSEDKKYSIGISLPIWGKSLYRKWSFLRQAEIEQETIRNCKNVILDSDFAKSYCYSISSDVRSFHRVLMPNTLFQKRNWKIERCQKHSIFTIFGSSAEKGTHNLLKAVSIVKRNFPDITVNIPGIYDLDAQGSLMPGKKGSFQNVLYSMIQDFGLDENVHFTGRLSAPQMAEALENCHLFVNPSCMEVHALSLREAMLVGVPSISAQCGSVAEYLKHKENGLIYRYEEYESLAYYINMIFQSDELAKHLSGNAKNAFLDMQKADLTLNQIYEELLR